MQGKHTVTYKHSECFSLHALQQHAQSDGSACFQSLAACRKQPSVPLVSTGSGLVVGVAARCAGFPWTCRYKASFFFFVTCGSTVSSAGFLKFVESRV